MAVLAAILPVVGQSSKLALEIYKRAAALHDKAASDLTKTAKAISGYASILKQVAVIIKEDDRLPSHEASEALEDIIDQSRSVFSQIEKAVSDINIRRYGDRKNGMNRRSSSPIRLDTERLNYLRAHLEALRMSLAVMLQTLYTAQVIMWSKLEPTVSPQKVEETVANEKTHLETLVIEQQISILSASRAYEADARSESRLLLEADSSQSLILKTREASPRPAELHRYQDKYIASLETSNSEEADWLPSLCSVATPHAEILLERWTSLPQFDNRIRDAERDALTQRREALQPMVEDADEDSDQQQNLSGSGTRMAAPPQKSDYVQPLFMEADEPPTPMRDTRYGPTAPLSPAASPRTSRDSVAGSSVEQDSPSSARSSISLPMEATAAVEAKEEDDDVDLEIPWTLCTRKYYWKYVDNKIVSSNTDQPPSIAFLERNNWTEIMASWVCKEAIKEAGYKVTQVQKDKRDGRRTRFETCFCVEQPLQFQQVKQLVERTVEIYRRSKPVTPPLPPPTQQRVRRSSYNRPPPMSHATPIDRDRTPIPQRPAQPPLDRSTTAFLVPPVAPRLDRSLSTPGPSGPMPIPGQVPPNNKQAHPSNLQIPVPPAQYSTSMPHGPFPPPPPQPAYSPQPYAPPTLYPPNSGFGNAPPLPTHLQPHNMNINMGMPQSLLRQPHIKTHSRSKYDDDYTTTDSDSGDRERRRHRSKSRTRHRDEKKKKSHNKSKAAGALLGVGGLTALLDGLSGL